MSDATVPLTASSMFDATNMTGSPLPDGERDFSPLMLSNAISRIAKLIFMIFCTIFGSTTNGYFVASFLVETSLQKLGYTYLACAGMADLLLTAIVIPASGVIILSGQWDTVDVCRVMQIIGQTATYAYSLFFMMASLESYFRICGTRAAYRRFLSIRVAWITGLVCCLCIALSVAGASLDFDYDYCEREFNGNIIFRIVTMVLLHAIPAVVTVALLIASKRKLQKRARTKYGYKRSRSYKNEYSIISMNITAYALFLAAWFPCMFVVFQFPGIGDSGYYYAVWVGLFRSVFTSFLYGIIDRTFKRSFANLFYYCYCKSALPRSRTGRQRHDYTRRHRPLEHKRAAARVRAHALQQIASGYPHTQATTSETRDL